MSNPRNTQGESQSTRAPSGAPKNIGAPAHSSLGTTADEPSRLQIIRAFFEGVCAFAIWGFFPLYLVLFKDKIAIGEVLAHRIFWSGLVALAIIALRKRLVPFFHNFASPKNFILLAVCSALLIANWYAFIYGIFTEAILEISLGYYAMPLLMALLGLVFLREPMRRLEVVALLITAVGIGVLTFSESRLPWISLTVAFSFGFYGMFRKRMNHKPVEGLCAEMLIATPCALTWIFALHLLGANGFAVAGNGVVSLLLVCMSFVSLLPLVLFHNAAHVLRYVTIGFMSYIGPSLQFFVATVILGEPFTSARAFAFVCIWIALALFSWEGMRKMTAKPAAPAPR